MTDPFLKADGTVEDLRDIVVGKNVCLVVSVPPPASHASGLPGMGLDPDYMEYKKADLVVRCNEWWEKDQGRCDIWFSMGYFAKTRPGWFFRQKELMDQLKFIAVHSTNGSSKSLIELAWFHQVPLMEYNFDTPWLMKLYGWFELRGTVPSTGMCAIYALCQCKPKSLYVTGMDLYSSDPKHKGWMRHNPIGHVRWLERLKDKHKFLEFGKDLTLGMFYWKAQDEDDNSK